MNNPVIIELDGHPLRCGWEYDAGEPTVMYYRDGSGHPGSPPSFMVNSVEALNPDGSVAYNLTGLLEELGALDVLEQKVLEQLGGYEAFSDPGPDPEPDDRVAPGGYDDALADRAEDAWRGERF